MPARLGSLTEKSVRLLVLIHVLIFTTDGDGGAGMETDYYDILTAPQLTNQFVPGYEGYQRRVGQMIKEQHRKVFWVTPNPDL